MGIKTKRALVRLFEAYVDLNSAKTLLEKKIESRSLSDFEGLKKLVDEETRKFS